LYFAGTFKASAVKVISEPAAILTPTGITMFSKFEFGKD